MRVADVLPELAEGEGRVLFAINERVMRIPEQANMRGSRLFEDIPQNAGIGEIAMRFQDYGHALGGGVVSESPQGSGDVLDSGVSRTDQLVAKHAHVGSAETRGQANETAGIGKLLFVIRARMVHFSGTADARNAQAAFRNFSLRLLDLSICKFGTRGEVHRSLQAAKLDGSETVLLCEVENLEPAPGRAAQRGKANGQALAHDARAGNLRQRRQGNGQSLKKLPPRYLSHQEPLRVKAFHSAPAPCSSFFMPAQLCRVDSSGVPAPRQ